MTASKGKAAVKIGMQYGKIITDSRFKIQQASKMKTKNLFQGCCQCSSWVRGMSVSQVCNIKLSGWVSWRN